MAGVANRRETVRRFGIVYMFSWVGVMSDMRCLTAWLRSRNRGFDVVVYWNQYWMSHLFSIKINRV
jgi:hypothetical protein